jgi:2-hydroxychromene-2-carboxylate isomerase
VTDLQVVKPTTPPDQPVFFYDLGHPDCYLLGERVMGELAVVPEWEPVHAAALGLQPAQPDPVQLAERIAAAGLQPLRLPREWPPDTEKAMLAATYAKHIGRAVAFSLAAFRQAFAGGRDLSDEGTVLIAAAACEMHPTALLKGMTLRSVTDGIRAALDRARLAGVTALPAIQVGAETFSGPDALDRAGEALSAAR